MHWAIAVAGKVEKAMCNSGKESSARVVFAGRRTSGEMGLVRICVSCFLSSGGPSLFKFGIGVWFSEQGCSESIVQVASVLRFS
jgi:hypothetical protein